MKYFFIQGPVTAVVQLLPHTALIPGVDEVVSDDDVVTGLQEQENGVAADIWTTQTSENVCMQHVQRGAVLTVECQVIPSW